MINEYLSPWAAADLLNISMELGSPEAVKGAVEAAWDIRGLCRDGAERVEAGTLVAINLEPPLERPFHSSIKSRSSVCVMDELLHLRTTAEIIRVNPDVACHPE